MNQQQLDLARPGCLQMGLGKTVQGVALCACFKEEWPVLIIAPASLRGEENPCAELLPPATGHLIALQ